MPGRDSTRSRCISGGAVTTTTWSTRSLAAGLEKQRYVERPPAARPRHGGASRKAVASARTSGCTIASSRFSAAGSPSTRFGELRPVDHAIDRRARKGRLHQRRRLAAIEPVHRLVGIVHRHAEVGETSWPSSTCPCRSSRSGRARSWLFRRGRLHVGDDHGAQFGVTSGRLPNQRSKPGTAWWSSMPSPSTVLSPRCRAAASSGVSSGT